MKHIKGLDTLRAFAVLFVIIQHMGFWFDTTTRSGILFSRVLIPDGGLGVFQFFVLSGFLITSILLNAKDNDLVTPRPVIIKNFFIRRALRIFPIYYILLLILFLFNYPGMRQNIGYFATYTSNILSYRTDKWNTFSHSWTLSVEEQFYLVWPWLMLFVRDKYIKYVFFGAVLTGIITTYITLEVQHHMAPLLVTNCFDAFGIGGLYAWARLKPERCKKFETIVKILVLPTLCAYFYWKMPAMYDYHTHGGYLIKTVNSILSLWLIMLVVNNRSARVEKYFLGNRFLNYIGKISYGIYLYHCPYIAVGYTPFNNFLAKITASHPAISKFLLDSHQNYWIQVSMMVLIAAISYELIEKPLLRLKKRFNYNGRKNKAAISPVQTQ